MSWSMPVTEIKQKLNSQFHEQMEEYERQLFGFQASYPSLMFEHDSNVIVWMKSGKLKIHLVYEKLNVPM